jgi:hypothetical protein
MLNDLQASSVDDREFVYWHGELPPLEAEPIGEHTVEAGTHVGGRRPRAPR